MSDSLQEKSAAEVTHFLKEVIGKGSMKRGVQFLLNESAEKKQLTSQLNNSVRSGKIKNVVIFSLLFKMGIDFVKKIMEETQKKENDISPNIEAVKEAVNNMTEDEIENLVENSLEEAIDQEKANNDKEV